MFECVQVYDRLQKVGLCLSHGRTIKLVDRLGEGFDEQVLHWKSQIESTMDPKEIDINVVSGWVLATCECETLKCTAYHCDGGVFIGA